MTGGAWKMHSLMSVLQRLVSRIPNVFASAGLPGALFDSKTSTVALTSMHQKTLH